jgi:CheY-like chemotaxis protein
MASVWRDSLHGARFEGPGDESGPAERATALLLGIDPARAIALVRLLAPLARARLAADLHAALAMAPDLQPDLVLLSSAMEDADIETALAVFGEDPALQEVPVIVLAAHTGDASERAALRGGALAWLPHAAGSDALLPRVRLAIRVRQTVRSQWGDLSPPEVATANRQL